MPWLWTTPADRDPINRFTWFRTRVTLEVIPPDAVIRFAASSAGQIFLNGIPLRRKMTRFGKRDIRAEVIPVAALLKPGPNVIAVLHHHWGQIRTFQRDAETPACLYVAASFLDGATWKHHPAGEFLEHPHQIVGIFGGDQRIRFPVLATPAKQEEGLHNPAFDAASWSDAVVLPKGPWGDSPDATGFTPADIQIPPQREVIVLPAAVLAAGAITSPGNDKIEPLQIAPQIAKATLAPNADLTHAAAVLVENGFLELVATADNLAHYITLDFHRPLHGFPAITWIGNPPATVTLDLGYAELHTRQYDGYEQVKATGALDPEAVVGKGYSDRITLTPSSPPASAANAAATATFELPDERTARWLTLHIRFSAPGTLRFKLHFISSQYPAAAVGSFHCADNRIMQAVALCDIHARVTMVDGYVDTPGREDGLWIEDARFRARIGASWYGDDALRKFGIRQYAAFIRDDGNSHPFAPSNYPINAPLDWSSQWLGMLYDQYLWSGDAEFTRGYWPKVRALVNRFLANIGPDGIWREGSVLGDIRLGFNVSSDKQSSGIITPWVIALLAEAATLADALGEAQDKATYLAAKEKLIASFRKVHLVPAAAEIPLYAATVYAPDDANKDRGLLQAAQCLPTTLGLFTPDEARAALTYTFDEAHVKPRGPVTRWNNPTYFQRALEALSHAGLTALAWSHFRERFSQFLPAHPNNPTPLLFQGPTGGPLPEYGITRTDLALKDGAPNTAQPPDDTGSHGWYATPLLWLHEHVLGITLATPGGAHLTITPQPGPLTHSAGHVHTPKGTVWLSLDTHAGTLALALPPSTTATLTLPWPDKQPTRELTGPCSLSFQRS